MHFSSNCFALANLVGLVFLVLFWFYSSILAPFFRNFIWVPSYLTCLNFFACHSWFSLKYCLVLLPWSLAFQIVLLLLLFLASLVLEKQIWLVVLFGDWLTLKVAFLKTKKKAKRSISPWTLEGDNYIVLEWIKRGQALERSKELGSVFALLLAINFVSRNLCVLVIFLSWFHFLFAWCLGKISLVQSHLHC